mmetsp:Transcript_80274/g.160230  ORF Transcript_80274/g.160230 Transcript_80274/m.160230 type:complete len:320 (-) Transcript_80274:210-1169(-)
MAFFARRSSLASTETSCTTMTTRSSSYRFESWANDDKSEDDNDEPGTNAKQTRLRVSLEVVRKATMESFSDDEEDGDEDDENGSHDDSSEDEGFEVGIPKPYGEMNSVDRCTTNQTWGGEEHARIDPPSSPTSKVTTTISSSTSIVATNTAAATTSHANVSTIAGKTTINLRGQQASADVTARETRVDISGGAERPTDGLPSVVSSCTKLNKNLGLDSSATSSSESSSRNSTPPIPVVAKMANFTVDADEWVELDADGLELKKDSGGGIEDLSASQLRVALKSKGLSSNGKKPQLQRRLAASDDWSLVPFVSPLKVKKR